MKHMNHGEQIPPTKGLIHGRYASYTLWEHNRKDLNLSSDNAYNQTRPRHARRPSRRHNAVYHATSRLIATMLHRRPNRARRTTWRRSFRMRRRFTSTWRQSLHLHIAPSFTNASLHFPPLPPFHKQSPCTHKRSGDIALPETPLLHSRLK